MMDRIEMKFEMMSSTYRIEPLAIADRQAIADPPGFSMYLQRNTPHPPIPEKKTRSATDCHSHKLFEICKYCKRVYFYLQTNNSIVVSICLGWLLLYVITYRSISSDPTFVITMGFTRNCLSFD